MLSVWDSLSSKDLILKSSSSESQVHLTLQRLIACDIVFKKSRGIYSLQNNSFTTRLADAYREQIKEFIDSKIYTIYQLLEEKQFDKADNELQTLELLYQPMLTNFFSHQLSGVSHILLDHYEQ